MVRGRCKVRRKVAGLGWQDAPESKEPRPPRGSLDDW